MSNSRCNWTCRCAVVPGPAAFPALTRPKSSGKCGEMESVTTESGLVQGNDGDKRRARTSPASISTSSNHTASVE